MSHFAKVVDGKVTQVIVAEPDFFKTFVDSSPGEWIQTSYNTIGNQHTQGGTPLRGNYAGIGFTYDRENDVFIAPKPFENATLNTETWLWEVPVVEEPQG
jgi:hypothetical protein